MGGDEHARAARGEPGVDVVTECVELGHVGIGVGGEVGRGRGLESCEGALDGARDCGHVRRVEPDVRVVRAVCVVVVLVAVLIHGVVGVAVGLVGLVGIEEVHRAEQIHGGHRVTERVDGLFDRGLEVLAEIEDRVGIREPVELLGGEFAIVGVLAGRGEGDEIDIGSAHPGDDLFDGVDGRGHGEHAPGGWLGGRGGRGVRPRVGAGCDDDRRARKGDGATDRVSAPRRGGCSRSENDSHGGRLAIMRMIPKKSASARSRRETSQ